MFFYIKVTMLLWSLVVVPWASDNFQPFSGKHSICALPNQHVITMQALRDLYGDKVGNVTPNELYFGRYQHDRCNWKGGE